MSNRKTHAHGRSYILFLYIMISVGVDNIIRYCVHMDVFFDSRLNDLWFESALASPPDVRWLLLPVTTAISLRSHSLGNFQLCIVMC